MTLDRKRFGKFKSYTMPGDSRIHAAGILTADFADSTELNGSADGLTIISGVVTERCRQDGLIRQVKARIYRVSGADPRKGIKFKVFRPNGANYDFVSESEYIQPSAINTQTYELTSPMACQPGDVLGLWLEGDSSNTVAISALSRVSANSILYAVGDISTTNAFSSTINNYSICIDAFCTAPYLCVTGDSIAEGQTAWLSHFDAGPAGTLGSEPWNQMRAHLPASFTYQNHADGAQTYAWVLSTGFPSAEATGARVILILCGVNDIDTARTWANVESDLDDILVLFKASTTARRLLICEIPPWTNGTDAQAVTVRTWNINLAAWCETNNVTLVLCHDALAQERISTGKLDDLAAAFDLDGVHLTKAGYHQLGLCVQPHL